MNGPEKDTGRVHDAMQLDGSQDDRRKRRVYFPVQDRKAAGKSPRSPSVQRKEADTTVLQNLMAFNSVGPRVTVSCDLGCLSDTVRVQLDTLLAALELYKENAENVATAAQVMWIWTVI